MEILRKIYRAWKRFALAFGRIMTVVWMVLFYLLFMAPFALMRFADPLAKRLGRDETYWRDRPDVDPTLESFSHPF